MIRTQNVEDLMFPRRTVMDMVNPFPSISCHEGILTVALQSLAIALFFAAQGRGVVRSSVNGPSEPYTSTARVLLNGLGADELLGGYGRFRTAFKHHGWEAIINEVCTKRT